MFRNISQLLFLNSNLPIVSSFSYKIKPSSLYHNYVVLPKSHYKVTVISTAVPMVLKTPVKT